MAYLNVQNFDEFVERGMYGALWLMFLFLPFATAPTVIAGLLSIVVWIFSGRVYRDWKLITDYRPVVPVFFLMILPWVGLLWSVDLDKGFDVAGKSYYWLYFFVIGSLVLRKVNLDGLFKAFLAGLTFNSLVSLLQFLNVISWQKTYGHQQTYGFMGHVASSLLLVFGILLCSHFYKTSENFRIRLFSLSLLILFLLNILIRQGRVGYLALIILCPIFLVNLFGKKSFLRLAVGMMIICSLLLSSQVARDRIHLIKTEVTSYLEGDYKMTSIGSRLNMWQGAVKIIMHKPVLGVGTGGYAKEMEKYTVSEMMEVHDHPHNSYLYILVSYGVVGGGLLLWFLITLLSRSYKNRSALFGFAPFAFCLIFIVGSLPDSMLIAMSTGKLLALMAGLCFFGDMTHESKLDVYRQSR